MTERAKPTGRTPWADAVNAPIGNERVIQCAHGTQPVGFGAAHPSGMGHDTPAVKPPST